MLRFLRSIFLTLYRLLWFTSRDKPHQYERPLGSFETLMHTMNQNGVLIISRIVFLNTKNPITKSHLVLALKTLMRSHPLLRMSVTTYDGEFYFKEMEDIHPEVHVDYGTDWQGVFSRTAAETFVDEELLWRVTLMPKVENTYGKSKYTHTCALVFGADHAIIDGQAFMMLVKELKELLSETIFDSTDILSAETPTSSTKMPKPVDELLAGKWYIAASIFNFFLRLPIVGNLMIKKLQSGTSKLKVLEKCIASIAKPDISITPCTCVYPTVIENTDLALILKVCKKKKLTVQSLIQAASIISLCELILEGASKLDIQADELPASSVNCTASIRKHPTYAASTMKESYVSSKIYAIMEDISIKDNADASKFWELAEHTMEYNHSNQAHFVNKILCMVAVMANFLRCTPSPPPRSRTSLMSFVNLGNCNYLNHESDENINISELYSCSGEHVTGPIFANCITTVNNQMFWGALYYPNVTSREFAARYLTRATTLLLTNCKLEGN